MFGSAAGTSAVPVAGATLGAAVAFSVGTVAFVSAALSLEQLASANSATRRVDRIFIFCCYNIKGT